MHLEARYDVLICTDTLVLIADRNDGSRTVTNDADAVVWRVNKEIGGLGRRRLYYRDSDGRFDEIHVIEGRFSGFKPCNDNQQRFLNKLATDS